MKSGTPWKEEKGIKSRSEKGRLRNKGDGQRSKKEGVITEGKRKCRP